jgi:hypothetical protein
LSKLETFTVSTWARTPIVWILTTKVMTFTLLVRCVLCQDSTAGSRVVLAVQASSAPNRPPSYGAELRSPSVRICPKNLFRA